MAFTKIAAAGIGTTETVTVDGLTVINNGSFGGNLSVGGTLTYEDVTNVDSVGLITARNGIVVGSGITLSKDGNIFTTGISTFGGNIQMGADNPEFEMNAGGPRFRVPSANTLSIFTTGGLGSTSDERLRITSGGNVGIGENSPANLLHVKVSDTGVSPHASAQIVLERSGTNYLQFLTANDGTSGLLFGDADDNDVAQIKYDHNTPAMLFQTEGAERLRIDSSGNVNIGSNTSANPFTYLRFGASQYGAADIRPTNEASHKVGLSFYVDGTQDTTINPTEALRITSAGNLGIGTVTPAALTHIYDATDTTSATEQFRISGGNRTADAFETGFRFLTQSPSANGNRYVSFTSNGNTGLIIQTHETSTGNAAGDRDILLNPENGDVGIGLGDGVTPSYRFHVKAGSVDQTARFDNAKTNDGTINYIGVSLGNASTTGTALFGITGHSTTGSQACWIGMAGDDVAGGYGLKVFRGGNAVAMQRFAVGTNDPAGYVSGTDASLVIAYSKTYRFGLHIRPTDNDTGGGSPALFQNNAGTTIGSITANASNIAYNTSSDYRLKENDISIIDGITRLKKLRPIKFNWKTDTEKTVDGFLAHEVSSSVPEAVIGEKDAVNEDGSIKPQQLDYSKLVPLLTAALQEEIAKRESLEARLDAAGL